MNSMCTELSIPLARKRPPEEQRALLHKWNEMGTDEPGMQTNVSSVKFISYVLSTRFELV